MTDPIFADALNRVAESLTAEVALGRLLWSTPDGQRAYGKDTTEGCSVTVVAEGARLVTSVVGVSLAALT